MKTPSSRLRTTALALGAVLGLATAAGCTSDSSGSGSSGAGSSGSGSAGSGSAGSTAGAAASGGDLQAAYMQTVDAVLPSVVSIAAGSGAGSGVVYDSRGDIVTNAHVIGTAREFTVTLATSGQPLKAGLVASYPLGDLAVIRLTSPPAGLKAAAFADSAKVTVGQVVLAMGNPLGLHSSVTQGIVSAVGRTVSEPRSAQAPEGLLIPDMVQTSAAINPGNSGGALVNLAHEIVGINTLAATDPSQGGSQAQGIGFAIPASSVTRLADQMIKNGRVVDAGRASLGVSTRTLVAADGTRHGAVVAAVVAGGPAAKAGLQVGDVITGIDGTAVDSSETLARVLTTHQPGEQATVTYVRDGSTSSVRLTLGSL